MSKKESLFRQSLPFGALRSNLCENCRPVDKLAAISLCNPDRDLLPEFRQANLSQLLVVPEETKPVPNDIARRLVVSSLEHVGNKFFQGGTKMHGHV